MAGKEENHKDALPHANEHIALIGLGAIGISFLALHLTYTSAVVSVYDPRPDLREHVAKILPLYLPESLSVDSLEKDGRLTFATTLADAVRDATVVQEQGPENLSFKQATWAQVVRHVAPSTHLWSSTSGIPASQQLEALSSSSSDNSSSNAALTASQVQSAKERLLIVHPFNPPHLMPLIEIVPAPSTVAAETAFAQAYFSALSSIHRPITLQKEVAGFVGNRLAFVLFREACALVRDGVCSAEDLDEIVRASLGPRWAVAGPFKMYAFGGGARGMRGFLDNIGDSIHAVWSDVDSTPGLKMRSASTGPQEDTEAWKDEIVRQTDTAYGVLGPEEIRHRDRGLTAVVRVQEEHAAEVKRGKE